MASSEQGGMCLDSDVYRLLWSLCGRGEGQTLEEESRSWGGGRQYRSRQVGAKVLAVEIMRSGWILTIFFF